MNTKKFTSKEIRSIKVTALARKYNCVGSYVSMILSGERDAKSILAQKILKDAQDMLVIINRETEISL